MIVIGTDTRKDTHQLWPELEIPVGALDRMVWLDRVGRRLARAEHGTRIQVAHELLPSIRFQVRRARELEHEIAALVKAKAPALLELPGCGAQAQSAHAHTSLESRQRGSQGGGPALPQAPSGTSGLAALPRSEN